MIMRTTWAERFFETFAGVPLTAECVFHSPQYLDKRTQKEVCDFLIILRGKAILVSMKTQENPLSRTQEKLQLWIIKNAREALEQAKGALRTVSQKDFWCHHSRRGRVNFIPSSITVSHIVVITEFLGEIVELPSDFKLSISNISVTYLSVNDFCNLLNELRAFPDIMEYLEKRRTLPNEHLRTIGDEKSFYKYYTLNNNSFNGCYGYEDARIVNAARDSEWQRFLTIKRATTKFSNIVENISDSLAKRLENYTEHLDKQTIARFDPVENRKHYLRMQEELCDLRLSERTALGEQFINLVETLRSSSKTEDMAYRVFYTDSKRDFIYVLISSKGLDRPTLINRGTKFLHAAMAYRNRERGMAIAYSDGKNFEVQMSVNFTPTQSDKEFGEMLFSHLKTSDIEVS